MPSYTDVQFISWEIYTGPNRGPLPWSRDKTGTSYTGLGNANDANDSRLDIEAQIRDIKERARFTYSAMRTAYDSATRHPSTLKVFMAPEFLYRGRGGAYIHDLINGWETKPPAEFNLSGYDDFIGLFGNLGLYSLEFEHWLCVFGTAISASFPTKNQNGKWVRDATQPGEIYNTAFIQHGGAGTIRGGYGYPNETYASRKHHKSAIDFIKQYLGSKAFTDGDVVPADRRDLEPNETNREGSAIFELNGVNDKDGKPIIFGLEVCLDHATSTRGTGSNATYPNWGRIRTADKWVKIQLVPSGGMSLQTASIRLLPAAGPTPHSYAFNCDGLTTLGGDWGAHTQIWNGANGQPVPSTNKLIEASYGQNANNTILIKVGDDLYWDGVGGTAGRTIHASNLWDKGAGYVRVMPEMQL